MAAIGQYLEGPEQGWQRINDDHKGFSYSSKWVNAFDSGNYKGDNHYGYTIGDTITFKFTGTKLRILCTRWSDSGTADVTIDGVVYPINTNGLPQYRTLVFDNSSLSSGTHTVEIKVTQDGYLIRFDAIDIDETGELLPYNPSPTPVPTNLTATAGEAKVTLNWNAVTDVTGYDVKRSTTVGGPYTTIASNVSGASYIDSSVTNGTTYYYVVTAINTNGESANSNEASATPTAPPDPELHILLEVGKQIQLIGNTLPEQIGDPNLEWNSTFPNIASVDTTGKVTANAEGVTHIQVKTIDGTWTDYALVEVVAKSEVDQYRLSILLKVGESCLLKFAADADVIWQSGDPIVATVAPSNAPITRVTAHAEGLSLITVKTADGSKRDQIYVTVIK